MATTTKIVKLECVFQYCGKTCTVAATGKDGFLTFLAGFWVNDQLELSDIRDGTIWIPPGQIDHIRRSFIEKTDFYDKE